MDLQELTNLISIRNYVANSVDNSAISRENVKELHNTLLVLDQKIIGMLKAVEFKEYVGYENLKKVLADTVQITNIKSSLKK